MLAQGSPMEHTSSGGQVSVRPAGIWLVVAAAVYDALVALAIVFAATAIAVTVSGGHAIPPGTVIYEVALLATPFPYFAWCWMRGGKTLGMRAWRLRLERVDGEPVTIQDATLRYVGALLSWAACALGFAWLLLGPRHMSWHDRMSATRVYREA